MLFCIKLPKWLGTFAETKYITFLIKDKQQLKNIMKYWVKLVKFNKELIYNRKYLNTKIKNYNEKCITNFHFQGIPSKENTERIFIFQLY